MVPDRCCNFVWKVGICFSCIRLDDIKFALILPDRSTCYNFLPNEHNFTLSLNFSFQSFAMAKKKCLFNTCSKSASCTITKTNLFLRVHPSALTTNWKEWFKEHQQQCFLRNDHLLNQPLQVLKNLSFHQIETKIYYLSSLSQIARS